MGQEAGSGDRRRLGMRAVKICVAAFVLAVDLATGLAAARAEPTCDAATEPGWRVVPSLEIAGVQDGPPQQSGADWVVERTTSLLPMCSYFTPVGSYSLKSYSLDPETRTERVVLCHAAAPVAPYAGPCPPK
jgi:hypothetical protein